MSAKREYPDAPVVGVGGVVLLEGCVLLIRRGSEPLKGQWSIPGGTLELGETLEEGVRRELREETSLDVRVLELIEVFERITPAPEASSGNSASKHPQYHFVIVDYLCEVAAGSPQAGSDVTDVALVKEEDLSAYSLTPTATRIVRKAFAMGRARAQTAVLPGSGS